MHVIVLKYVQLLCVSIFMRNNANCAQIMRQSEETQNLKVAACSANCLQSNASYTFEICYQQCDNEISDILPDVIKVHQPHNASSFDLFCRDSKRLFIKFNGESDSSHVGDDKKFIYLLSIQETKVSFVERTVYMSDNPIIELAELKSGESYNVSATIILSNNRAHFLGYQIFTTLMSEYKPEIVDKIWTDRIRIVNNTVDVDIRWEPARDKTCHYTIILFADEEINMKEIEKGDRDLYRHTFKGLERERYYSYAIRGVNVQNKIIESDLYWSNFTTPECTDESFCGPDKITELNVMFTWIKGHVFDCNVKWNTPSRHPDYYLLEIRDVDPPTNMNGTIQVYEYEIDSDQTSLYINSITINGWGCLINLTAVLNGKSYEAYEEVSVPPMRPFIPIIRDDLIFYAFVVIVVVIFIILFQIWKRRIVSIVTNITQKRKEDTDEKIIGNTDLDLVKTLTNRSMLEAIADLTKDETMEIERDHITILDALGEGAFGYVKRAFYNRDGQKYQVAVKMLKNGANYEDINQFHQEISVMKSVGRHQNIVSIIGHCTSNIEELMLLTEYCDIGNLLEFLRAEFARQLSFYDTKYAVKVPMTPQKHLDNLLNFDMAQGDTKGFSYKNIESSSSRLFVANQMYDDLNSNANRNGNIFRAIELTASNALYLELSENNSSESAVVEMANVSTQNFLNSHDLLSFAKQVSEGMDFLTHKKVVHRDLAARNILLCSGPVSYICKIADFGLSRDIYQDNIYRKTGNGKLPIKWLAIESMTHQVYTEHSDVWSFGILLYEIVMLGATPYPSIHVEKLLQILETGYRMEKPNHCHSALYDLMMSCWHANPQERPSFEEIFNKLNSFMKLENVGDEPFVDVKKIFDKYMGETNSSRNYMKPIA